MSHEGGTFPSAPAIAVSVVALMAWCVPCSSAPGDDLTIVIEVDGRPPLEFNPAGRDVGGGVVSYVGDVFEVGFSVSFDVRGAVGTGDACTPAQLTGAWSVTNTSIAPLTIIVSFSHVAAPTANRNAIAIASIGGSMTADLDGGTLASLDGSPIGVAKFDATPIFEAYPSFTLALSGGSSGSVAPDCSYKPTELKSAVVGAISFAYAFSLTAGEQLGFSSVLIAAPPPCPDFDGDGVVGGSDLGQMLAQWGTCEASDLDFSGTVDGGDLGLLLAEWGQACLATPPSR